MFHDFRTTHQIAPIGINQSSAMQLDQTISGSRSVGAAALILHRMSGAKDGKVSPLQTGGARTAGDTSERAALYLAPRELDVLKWAAQGKTTWETAQLLNLSEATVAFYTRRACARLGVKSKIHAVAVCISAGLFKI
ncbi:response regulator transcription factor [Thalassorhabdomicrobium marinisediminis]|nr:LuxR C-terminal-related transcriptional regulator [Thalassorhabdomicrobium marinisediminis]